MINFLLGRQTDPIQEKILDLATKNYKQNPENKTFIIVPNHIKFTTEVRAINKLAISEGKTETAVKNLQVLSFSRLAWYFLKDVEVGLPTQLDDAAAAMLLAQIIDEHRQDLLLFKNTNINSGLVKQLYKTILQIYEGNIDLAELQQANLDTETANKIHDLQIIYQAFLTKINGKFSTKNEIQLRLNEILAEKVDLTNASFYFSDFSHFSLQEALTIKLLMQKAKNVTMGFATKLGAIDPKVEIGDYDYVIQQTIKQLISFLDKRNIECKVEQFPITPGLNLRKSLNNLWINSNAKINGEDLKYLKQVQFTKADSRYAEAYFVAHTIYQQVASAKSNYRYRDFLVLAPNLHEYETYLIPILRQNKIPFFNDLQQEMKYHPLVVLIENLEQLLKRPLQTTNLLAILKTRLLIPDYYRDEAAFTHDVDELENFVLAHGINHHLWQKQLSDFLNASVIKLDKMPEEVARLDKLRSYIVNIISKLLLDLKQEKDSQKAITIFFNFLINNGVTNKLEKWRDISNNDGDLQAAQQPEQLWELLITLLKDYLLINPDNYDVNGFFEMLISAFKEATFSQIPSTLDAVNISEIGMVQNSGYKQVFIIGATSSNLPKIEKAPGFITAENIQAMQAGFGDESYIEDRQQLNNIDQDYQFGLAMALAQDRLYISYPVVNADNERLEPSIFYERLYENLYGNLYKDSEKDSENRREGEFEQHDLPDPDVTSDLLSFITNPEASLGYLAYLNRIKPNDIVDTLLKMSKKAIPDDTNKTLAATDFDNLPIDIGEKLAQELYGSNLNASVSQLETYYQNSYEYFLNYGLKLKPRFENEFNTIQAGNYFHETFDRLVKQLQQLHLDLGEIDELKLEQLLNNARIQMQTEGKYAQLMNDPFNKYLFKCLDHTTSHLAYNWHKKMQETPMRAKYSELSFGAGEQVKGIDLAIPNLLGEHQVRLRGKIDRVDMANLTDTDKKTAQVIDYKSSSKDFDISHFYSGLSLQMISYLDVLTKNSSFFTGNNKDQLEIIGGFYQVITRKLKLINSKQMLTNFALKEELLNSKPDLRYTGLITTTDIELLQQVDKTLLNQKSKIYPLRLNKDGSFSKNKKEANSRFSKDELKLLLAYDEYLIQQAAGNILSGKIELNPFKFGDVTALNYSDYRDAFFFDAMLERNQYRKIMKLDKKELLNRIREILDEGRE